MEGAATVFFIVGTGFFTMGIVAITAWLGGYGRRWH